MDIRSSGRLERVFQLKYHKEQKVLVQEFHLFQVRKHLHVAVPVALTRRTSGLYCSTTPFSLTNTGTLLGMDVSCFCRFKVTASFSIFNWTLRLFPESLTWAGVVFTAKTKDKKKCASLGKTVKIHLESQELLCDSRLCVGCNSELWCQTVGEKIFCGAI